MNVNLENLLQRFPSHPRADEMKKSATAAIVISEQFAARRSEMLRSGSYTEAGVLAAMHGAIPQTLRQLRGTRAESRKLRADIEAQKAALRPEDPDRSDLAGAMERAEIREFIRGLAPTDRMALAMGTDDLRLLRAIVTAPPELSGFAREEKASLDAIEERYVALAHPGAMQEITDLEAVAAAAEAVDEVVRGMVKDTAGLDDATFAKLAEQADAAVWIVGEAGREQVCEMTADGQATYRVATPDEVAIGVRYHNAREFYAAKAA